MIEQWKSVVGWEGFYEVSNLGNVRSVTRKVRSRGGYRHVYGQIMRLRKNRGGYWQVIFCREQKAQTRVVHRLVAEAFLGPAPEGKPYVLHGDGDRDNNKVTNLRWGDNSDNMQDAIRHGTYVAYHGLKTHCPRGHEFTDENTYIIPSTGSRSCRICKKRHSAESYRRVTQRKKEALND